MTKQDALIVFRTACLQGFTPFTDRDWECWSGCETAEPVVCYVEGGRYTAIVDGEVIQVLDSEDETFENLRMAA